MIDIAHTENGDILLIDNLAWAEPTAQHQRDILLAAQGDFKQSPEMGVDSALYINESDPDDYLQEIRLQMSKDGMKVRDVALDAVGNLTIDADYE